jgi:hypothetical protein
MEAFMDRLGDDKKYMEDVVSHLRKEFNNISSKEIDIPFNHFAFLVGFSKIHCLESFQIEGRQQNTYLAFAQMEYTRLNRGKYAMHSDPARELQAYIIVKLSKDFGHFLVKKETFANKVMEIFQPLELDFAEDSAFSKKFYVLSKDKEKTISFISAKVRDRLKLLQDGDAFIEVLNDTMLIGNGKLAGHESLIELIKLGCDLDRLMDFPT